MQRTTAYSAVNGALIDAMSVGTVYGVVLNDRRSLEKMGSALEGNPYKAPPKAPVLYIKPRNTLSTGITVTLPGNALNVEIGATLGVVIGVEASRIDASRAAEVIQGYLMVADLSLPHGSYYRPAIREKCFDGSCIVTPDFVPAVQVGPVEQLVVRTQINDRQVDAWPLADLVRSVPQLIADVTEFMTLRRGDVLLVGVPWDAPQATAGDDVTVWIEGVGVLVFRVESCEEGAGK